MSELLFNVNNYSCTNLASLPQLLPRRFTMCSSLSFQRYLITWGVIKIAHLQTFTNVSGIEDHAFNHASAMLSQKDLISLGAVPSDPLVCRTCYSTAVQQVVVARCGAPQ